MKRPTLYSAIQGVTLILLAGTTVYLESKLSQSQSTTAFHPRGSGVTRR